MAIYDRKLVDRFKTKRLSLKIKYYSLFSTTKTGFINVLFLRYENNL